MSDLLKAIQIFLKYGDPYAPINCQHDKMTVYAENMDAILPDDIKELETLGFFWDAELDAFSSYRFGSC